MIKVKDVRPTLSRPCVGEINIHVYIDTIGHHWLTFHAIKTDAGWQIQDGGRRDLGLVFDDLHAAGDALRLRVESV